MKILFLLFTYLLLVLTVGQAHAQFSNEALDRAQRAIQHNNEMMMENQRTRALETQQIRDRYNSHQTDYYQRQNLYEQQETNRNLRRLNRGY